MSINHLSLFSGIGGLDLAAEWAGMNIVGQCEWAEFPTKVLEKHWPDVPRWKDIRTLTKESFYERTGLRTVDIISGGFPCQPFSVAGKQRGKEDDRYLWSEMVRVIKELRPTWIVGENVAGIVRMALADILSELEACGYRTRTFLIPACAVGARHRRYRVAIVAWDSNSDDREEGPKRKMEEGENTKPPGVCSRKSGKENLAYTNGPGLQTPWPEQQAAGLTGNGKDVANTESQHEGRLSIGESQKKPGFISGGKDVQHSDSAGRKKQHVSGEPSEQRFPGGGCNAGNVCDPAGPGLPDGTSVPVGGYGTPEPEPERSGSDVSNTDHGSRTVRRNGKTPAAEEVGAGRCDHGGGTEEHVPGEWRTTQPGLGGMADGISGGLDRDFLINHYWNTEPDIPRVAVGVPDRVGRLKALGNAVVPQQFYPFFKAIADVMEEIP